MKQDVHMAALRAASKVAFSVAFLAGCSSGGTDDAANPADESQESEVKSGKACEGKKFTCNDLVNAAFPEVGNYPGKKVTASKEVVSCCNEILLAEGAGTAHRWDCCANASSTDQKVFLACTPWGPPVPPAMKARREQAPAAALGVA